MKTLLPLLSLSSLAQALYFYIDGSTPKCFFEEMPKDTMVVGHYTAEEWDDNRHAWWKHDGISIYISVDVCVPLTPPPCLFLRGGTNPLLVLSQARNHLPGVAS